MHRSSSSTSSSDAKRWSTVALTTLGSLLVCLLAFDLVIGAVVGNPYDRPRGEASQLSWYVNYGRSIEGKVRAMLGAEDGAAHPLARTGLIAPLSDQPRRAAENQNLLVAAYGMSFAANI